MIPTDLIKNYDKEMFEEWQHAQILLQSQLEDEKKKLGLERNELLDMRRIVNEERKKLEEERIALIDLRNIAETEKKELEAQRQEVEKLQIDFTLTKDEYEGITQAREHIIDSENIKLYHSQQEIAGKLAIVQQASEYVKNQQLENEQFAELVKQQLLENEKEKSNIEVQKEWINRELNIPTTTVGGVYDMQIKFKAADQLGQNGWKIQLSDFLQNKLNDWVSQNNEILEANQIKEGWEEPIHSSELTPTSPSPSSETSSLSPQPTSSRHLLSVTLTNSLSSHLLGMAIFCAVTGAFDRGKTWLINLLTNNNLPSGYVVETKGISIIANIEVEGLKGQVIIGDTEGTGRALTEEQCKCEEQALLKNYPKELGQMKIDDSNLSSDRSINEENLIRKDLLKSKALNMASMINNNTEKLLQEVVVDSANLILTVVCETNSMEQQYIKIMAERLNAQILKSGQSRHVTYIVVHNFKNCKTREELDELIKKYIIEIWGATEKKTMVGETTITTYVNESHAHKAVSIEHLYFGKQGTQAGVSNEIFVKRIRQCLSDAFKQKQENKILWSLLENIKTQLPEIYKKVGDVRLLLERHQDGTNSLKMVHINPTQKVLMPLQLISIEGEAKDYRYVTSEKKYTPQYDLIITENVLMLNLDVPGLKYKGWGKIQADPDIHTFQPMDLCSRYGIESNQFSILVRDKYFYIFGNRSLGHPKPKIDNPKVLLLETEKEREVEVPVMSEYATETSDMSRNCTYDNSSCKVEWTDRKRSFGNFYLKIYCEKLPFYSTALGEWKVTLNRGVFSLILRAAEKNVGDSYDIL